MTLDGYNFPARVTIMSAAASPLGSSFYECHTHELHRSRIPACDVHADQSAGQRTPFIFDTCIRPFVNYSRYLGPPTAQSYDPKIYSIYFENCTSPQMIDTLVLDGVVGVYWHLCTDPLMRGCLFNNLKGEA